MIKICQICQILTFQFIWFHFSRLYTSIYPNNFIINNYLSFYNNKMNENVINNTLMKRKWDKYVKNCQIHFIKFPLIRRVSNGSFLSFYFLVWFETKNIFWTKNRKCIKRNEEIPKIRLKFQTKRGFHWKNIFIFRKCVNYCSINRKIFHQNYSSLIVLKL